ncbi:MAG: hypothetical protein ACOYJU_07855 [Anaerovoracaceae bacterium]
MSQQQYDYNQNNTNQMIYTQQEVNDGKAFAILAYLGILVLIPIFAAKDNKFARYHANQGLILFIGEVIYAIIYQVVAYIVLVSFWGLYWLLTILGLVGLVFLVFAILGIVNAASGKAKELPVVGGIQILK